jgi:hypothetical protein
MLAMGRASEPRDIRQAMDKPNVENVSLSSSGSDAQPTRELTSHLRMVHRIVKDRPTMMAAARTSWYGSSPTLMRSRLPEPPSMIEENNVVADEQSNDLTNTSREVSSIAGELWIDASTLQYWINNHLSEESRKITFGSRWISRLPGGL